MHTRFSRVPYDLSSEIFTKYLTYMHDVLTLIEKGDNEYNDINANLTELIKTKKTPNQLNLCLTSLSISWIRTTIYN